MGAKPAWLVVGQFGLKCLRWEQVGERQLWERFLDENSSSK